MHDLLGYRLRIGIAIPSTNTSAQAEMDNLRPPGVTNHVGRMLIEDESLEEESGINSVIDRIRRSTAGAISSLKDCALHRLIVAVSPDSYWDGEENHLAMLGRLRALAGGAEITMSADAISEALRRLGDIRQVGVITPYLGLADDPVRRFFIDRGYEVLAIHGLGGTSPTRISDVTIEKLRHAVETVDQPGVQAIVQVGTNVPMANFATIAETWIGKPVISNNAVLYWHALRSSGITDPIPNQGALFSRH